MQSDCSMHVTMDGTLDGTCRMDGGLKEKLYTKGITVTTLKVLEEEQILMIEVFKSLRKEHLDQLISKMALGQHAILLKLWITEVSAVYIVCNIVIASYHAYSC